MKHEETQGQYSVVEVEDLSWPLKKISEISDVNPRIDKKTIPDDMPVSFVPMPAVGAGDGSIRVDETRLAGEVKKGFTAFLEGDILFAKITPCMENGKMAVVPPLVNGYGFGSTEFHVIRPKPGTYAKYLYYYVSSQSFRKEAERHMTGAVGQRRVPTAYLKECTIPFPPLDQQKRIVAEIEKQFSRLDEGVASLKRVQANLKRYKAAVLKAAVEGRLVETEAELARREGRDYETGEQLLQRILAERRRRWEEAELAKMKARGKVPKNDKWKQKYKEPTAPDTNNLPELPEGWVWTVLDTFLFDIEAGKSFKCEERPPNEDEVGVVKVSAVTWGDFDEDESKTCKNSNHIDNRLFIRPGDFLFSRANTIDLVGACVIARKVTKRIMLSDKILRFHLPKGLEHWVLYVLRSPFGRSEIERLATGNQESMRNIGQDRIRAIRIPVPSLREQHRIVAEVDRRLSILREVEAQVETNLQRAERLRQSILAAAFSGRLVPTEGDSNHAEREVSGETATAVVS